MLIKATKVINLPIYTLKRGKEVDRVKDVIYDPYENRIKALLIDEGGWFREAKVILIDDLKSIGKDAVIIDSREMVKKASDVKERVASIAQDSQYLTHTKVITEEGENLGRVSDLYFESTNGQVKEFEVSQGAFQNIKSGKKIIRIDDIVTVGEDATIVKGYTVERVEKQAQRKGLQGAINKGVEAVKTKTPQIAQQAKERTTQTARDLKERAQEFRDSPKTQRSIEQAKQKIWQAQDRLKEETEEAVSKTQQKVREFRNDPQTRRNLEKASEKVEEAKDTVKGEALKAKKTVSKKAKKARNQAKRTVNNKNRTRGKATYQVTVKKR